MAAIKILDLSFRFQGLAFLFLWSLPFALTRGSPFLLVILLDLQLVLFSFSFLFLSDISARFCVPATWRFFLHIWHFWLRKELLFGLTWFLLRQYILDCITTAQEFTLKPLRALSPFFCFLPIPFIWVAHISKLFTRKSKIMNIII